MTASKALLQDKLTRCASWSTAYALVDKRHPVSNRCTEPVANATYGVSARLYEVRRGLKEWERRQTATLTVLPLCEAHRREFKAMGVPMVPFDLAEACQAVGLYAGPGGKVYIRPVKKA